MLDRKYRKILNEHTSEMLKTVFKIILNNAVTGKFKV